MKEYKNAMICELKTSKKKEILYVLHTIFLRSQNKLIDSRPDIHIKNIQSGSHIYIRGRCNSTIKFWL